MSEPVKMPIPGPYPTQLPGPGEPLAVARVHGARAPRRWMIALAVLVALACSAFGALLSRMDTARQAADLARTEAQRAYAHTAVLRVELEHVRATMPKPGAVDEVCRRRTVAIRGALLALVRTGAISIPNDPGAEWITWR